MRTPVDIYKGAPPDELVATLTPLLRRE